MPSDKAFRGRRLIFALVFVLPVAETAAIAIERLESEYTFSPLTDFSWALFGYATITLMKVQIILPALWLAWGTRRLWARVVVFCVAPIVCCAESAVANLLPYGDYILYESAALVFAIEALILVLIASILRLVGFRLQRFTSGEFNGTAPIARPLVASDYHFSLLNLFAWTAIVAVICAVVRFAACNIPWDVIPWEEITGYDPRGILAIAPNFLVITALESVIPIILAWAVLTPRQLSSRMLIATPLSIAVFLVADYAGEVLDWQSLLFVGVTDITLICSLMVFRMAGYRLLWRRVRISPIEERTSEGTPHAPFAVRDRELARA